MIINNYVIISIIIMLICGGLISYSFYKDGEKISDCISSGIMTVAIVGFVLFIIGVFVLIGTDGRIKTQYTTQSELVALNDFTGNKSSVNGSFFLCVGGLSGSSSDTYNVRYASKDENEVIKINTMEVNNNNIGFVEDGSTKVIIIHNRYVYQRNKLGEWLFGKDNDSDDGGIERYEFHVPKDSITNDIKVDLK